MKKLGYGDKIDNPNNPEIDNNEYFNWDYLKKQIIDIMYEFETTQGYEDGSNIIPINGLTNYEDCTNKIIEFLKDNFIQLQQRINELELHESNARYLDRH